MNVSNVAIDRPVFTTMCAMAVMVMGALALVRLDVDLFPEISFPVVAISTVYPGASPSEIEQQVSKPLEEAVATVNGVDTIRSYSRDSVSVIIVFFKLETDLLSASTDVRDRVQQARRALPDGVEDPIINKFDPSAAPIMTFSVRSKSRSSTETRRILEDTIKPALEQVEGVGGIDITGGSTREIHIDLDQQKLQALGMSVSTVAQLLRAESLDLPGGRVTQAGREFSIKASGRFQSPEDVANVVLTARADGTQIHVRDIGDVVDSTEEVRTITRTNGEAAVLFNVQKQSGGNTVKVSDGVMHALEKLAPRLKSEVGPDVQVTLLQEQAHFIRNNIERLREHLILGGLLAIFVIFFFMRDVRSTLISAVALPASVIATFFVMWRLGFTLNIMSMLAITLSIGLLIDDSVVVRENIFRHLEHGADPITAARKGTSEIALAVFATTMAIVAVFVPIGFMEGIIGRFFKQFGLTIAAAVLVSLVVSFTLDPMMSARIAQRVDPDRDAKLRVHPFYKWPTIVLDGLDSTYRVVLHWALGHKKTVIGGATAIFLASLGLPAFMGTEFFTRGDQGKFQVSFELPPGTALAESDRIALRAEALLKGIPEAQEFITTVGVDRDAAKFDILVLTTPLDERERGVDAIMESARTIVRGIPGADFKLSIPDLANNGAPQAAINIVLSGPEFAELDRIAQATLKLVQQTPGTRDVSLSARPGSPEQRFVVDRKRAADRGVTFASAAMALRHAVEGDVVASIDDHGDDVDVRVRLGDSDRATVHQLNDILVMGRQGLVKLGEVVTLEESVAPAVIERNNRQRAVSITANLSNRSLGEVMNDIQAGIKKLDVKPGYTFKYEGDAENMRDTFENMLIALALAVLFIYFVLASQFESFKHPFTIMLALPLAIVGALAALFLTGLPIGMPAMIGIILLMGLVTKNGILLVDYTNTMRKDRGASVEDALREAGATRLRPILMTSAAIVLGELPTALSTAEGSEFNAPMAVAVIGGVITSTVLTLVVVPVAYVWIDRIGNRRAPVVVPPAE